MFAGIATRISLLALLLLVAASISAQTQVNLATQVKGTLASSHLPNPTAGAGGKVQSKDCTGTGHVLSINTDSTVTCSADAGGGGGSVTTSGSPASGNLTKFSGATVITNGDLSGDVTTAGTLVSTVGKVNGVAYSASPGNHTVPVITASNTATYKTVPDCTDTGGNHINYTQSTDTFSCGTSGGAGGGVTSVALTMPAEFSVSGSPITTSGTLAVTKATQSANLVFAGPSSGSAAAPTFRALVALDLPVTPDTPPSTANAMDDEFNAGSLDTGLWTWVNQGSATATLSKGWLSLFAPSGASDSLRMIVQTAPSTPWEVTARVTSQAPFGNASYCGLVLRESGSGKLITFSHDFNAGTKRLRVVNWASSTSATAALLTVDPFHGGPFYLRIKADGTNLIFSYSFDGVSFAQLYSEAKGAHFTTAPDQVGIAADGTNQDARTGVDWFRRTL